MMTILDEEEFIASAVAYPASTEDVQLTVRWANKYRVPIFPISMGRNRMHRSLSYIREDADTHLDQQSATAARPPASAAP